MGKLERLAQRRSSSSVVEGPDKARRKAGLGKEDRKADKSTNDPVAKRKTLFDDRPVEIAELTYIIKQDLSSLNSQISSLQTLSRSQHPASRAPSNGDQENEHNKNVGPDSSSSLP